MRYWTCNLKVKWKSNPGHPSWEVYNHTKKQEASYPVLEIVIHCFPEENRWYKTPQPVLGTGSERSRGGLAWRGYGTDRDSTFDSATQIPSITSWITCIKSSLISKSISSIEDSKVQKSWEGWSNFHVVISYAGWRRRFFWVDGGLCSFVVWIKSPNPTNFQMRNFNQEFATP